MNYCVVDGIFYSFDELQHHGIKGQQWGVRRFQNDDGSLTDEGKRRYSESLSNIYDKDDDYDGDYAIPKGSSAFRRSSSYKDSGFGDDKYSYVYDYDNSVDDKFYEQFGRKVSAYTVVDDIVLAGKSTIGKAFVDKMLSLDNEDDIDAMDTLYYDSRHRLGKDYVEDLFSLPYEPSKHIDALEKAGADMVSRMLSTQRNDVLDAKLQRRGIRDLDTAANDIGRSIVDKLLSEGYSGIRDYNDYGSAAGVTTPTVIFDPNKTLNQLDYWLDEYE